MANIERITLEEYLKRHNTKVKKRQPASMVSPQYRQLPKNEQIESGVIGVEEVTLTNKEIIFICSDCTRVFGTAISVNSHRATAHPKDKDVKTDNIQVEIEKPKKAAPNSVATRQKNISKATTTNAPKLTYPQVLEKLKTIEAKYRKEFDEWCKSMEVKNTEAEQLKDQLENATRANNFLQMTIDQLQREREDWESEIAGLKRKIDEFENPKTALDRRLVVAVEIALEDLREKFEKAYAIQLEADKRIAESLS